MCESVCVTDGDELRCKEEGIADVNEMLRSERPQADRRLRDVLSELGTACSRYLTLNQSRTGAATGRTRLDVARLKMCQREIVRVSPCTLSLTGNTRTHEAHRPL